MRYLLDSCTWIFLLTGDSRLKNQQQQVILDRQHTIYISVVSIWEMTIKIGKGKLQLPKPIEELVSEAQAKDNYNILDLDVFSVINIKNLPYHHQDPFDRMLISQAIVHDLIIITNDLKFSNYNVKILDN